ncbi:MAG TPA: peptidylprolyl isomerase [Thermoguttaceae bacterium]|nr:peptidylprolyl isomerase [Thermoguttaceae bacterium]
MRIRFRPILTGLTAVVLLAAVGCNSDDTTEPSTDDAPAASIGGPGSEQLDSTPGVSPSMEAAAAAAAAAEAERLHPRVRIHTSMGPITVELDAERTPQTVDNFLNYVQNGHYDQTIFHQVIKGDTSVIIGGAYTDELVEKEAGTGVYCEARRAQKNARATIAMARQPDAIDSATCHFFINLTDNEVLDYKDDTPAGYGYCAFGRVIEGMEAADKIGAVEVHDQGEFEGLPVQTVRIESMEILR